MKKVEVMRPGRYLKLGVVTFNGCRFDFEGWLLPYSEQEITEKSRVLYHHGDAVDVTFSANQIEVV